MKANVASPGNIILNLDGAVGLNSFSSKPVFSFINLDFGATVARSFLFGN